MTARCCLGALLLLLLAVEAAAADEDRRFGGNSGGGGGQQPQHRHAPVAGQRRGARSFGALAAALRERVDDLRSRSLQLELVFLIDASASVGEANFRGELGLVRRLLSDFDTTDEAVRVAIVTFAGRGQVVRHVDRVSAGAEAAFYRGYNDKCQLLTQRLEQICYSGGGTYTYGALMEAFSILEKSRANAEKVVFLVTDGFSYGADPRHAASLLKALGVTIFTFGVRSGNVEELRDIASSPSRAHTYILNSFLDFETLARKALHKDLKAGPYSRVEDPHECSRLCSSGPAEESGSPGNCCDPLASCSCASASGHYACQCPLGYFGNGLLGSCRPCPNGTYGQQNSPNDLFVSCVPCPDTNHVTTKIPAISLKDCTCASGFIGDRGTCEAIRCPKLKVPDNGYFVKANDCNNVVNAACGIRCRIGFHLTGDSIRLCSKNGSWTGENTQCLLKTCPALRAPASGRMRCEHESENGGQAAVSSKLSDKAGQPIDTRCQFKCENGFQLRGSKVRNCLPLARWDGLKTTCKPIFCEPLRPVVNAEIHPKSCLGPRKLPYAFNCTVTCKKGYKLLGPRTRMCVGRHGTWSKRHSVSRCLDKTRPVLKCPPNMTVHTLAGKNYAYVNWSIPNATDNSGAKCNVWSKPHVTFPRKVYIGKHTFKYFAQDISGNKAKCSFVVRVIDKEPPKIENCQNNRLYLSGKEKNLREFVWDEPLFYDNSGLPIKINKTFRSTTGPLTQGRHSVSYNIKDKYENLANCSVNLTIQDACDNVPKPLNGRSECMNIEKAGKQCSLFCNSGYAFAFDSTVSEELKSRTAKIVTVCKPTNHFWNLTAFPDCSPVKVPNTISHEGMIILEGDSVDCDNTVLMDRISKSINESYNFNVVDLCGNQMQCNISNEINCKEFIARVTRNVAYDSHKNTKRKKYEVHDNERITSMKTKNLHSKLQSVEIKFKFIAKIVEENRNNPQLGIVKIKEKLQSMAKSGELSLLDKESKKEIDQLALNLKVLFQEPQEICDPGSILKKSGCVKCPAGTFHNMTKGQCQSCYYGEYQSESGTTKCEKCPVNYFTRRMHARSITECIPACQPGYYSRQRHQPDQHYLGPALGPCVSCEVGTYQPRYGQSQCLPCPRDTTTEARGSRNLTDCVPANLRQLDPCRGRGKDAACLNGATCVKERDGFSCECREHFVGSRCEAFVDPCLSSPCSNAGQCILKNTSDSQWSYVCTCKPGYTGKFCEMLINECSYTPCRNGGTCLSTDLDITCTCKDGFEGDFCELAVNHCASSPCESYATCANVAGTWKCFCPPGYLGLRCSLMPCDWLPCRPTEICINELKENTTISDYRCECPEGFSGEDCQTRIDPCHSQPCLNNGTCTNNMLNYTCHCRMPFSGSRCETELSLDYVMHFSRSGTTDYAIIPGPSKNLTELTVCFWLQSIDTFNYGTVVSYATPSHDNAFTITDYNDFVLYVNGEKVITDARMNNGYWHFICISWENKLGSWQLYVDGALKDNGTLLAKNTEIEGNGMFVFGQEQDEIGGGFSESESFVGKLHLLDIWDTASGPDVINHLSHTCEKYYGSLVAWAQLREHIRGNIELVESTFCQGCPPPVTPSKGYVNMSRDGLEVTYTCETGYEFRKDHVRLKTLKRRCLKHGHWQGSQVPNCMRVNCPHPGYFLRGSIQGKSFMYGDKITYNCNEGYDLRGNPQRICKADGTWSGVAPLCIGVTCKNLLAPDHGDIEYIFGEYERDDLSILQVGHKLEFKCDPGYALKGQKYLTCRENGTWDYKRPTCVAVGCPPPKQIDDHSRIVSVNATSVAPSIQEEVQTLYRFGDIVMMSCEDGYKPRDKPDLEVTFQLECTSSGEWIGLLPNCVPRGCLLPRAVSNATIYLLDEKEENGTIIERILDQISDNSRDFLTNERFNDTITESENVSTDSPFAKSLAIGTRIKIVCDSGYESSSASDTRNCTSDEIWSGEDVYCKPKLCSAEKHPLLRLFVHDNLGNSTDPLPLDMTEDTSEAREDEAKKLRGLFDVILEGDGFGQRLALQCKNAEDTGGLELVWRCDENGVWSFESNGLDENETLAMLVQEGRNVCAKSQRCEAPEAPIHGFIIYENNTENFNETKEILESVIFKCNQGYTLVGAEKLLCLENGTWSNIPTCQPITCAIPQKVPYAELKNKITSSIFGNVISYQCVSGYRIIGQLTARCLANGQWSRVNGRCARISCGKPQLEPGASIQGNSFLYQDRLIYICPGGKFRNMIVCNRYGKWSTLPKCI